MNTNVGDMPIDIFGDYISDCLGIDFEWIYLVPMFNGYGCGIDVGCSMPGWGFGYGDKHIADANCNAKGQNQKGIFGNSYYEIAVGYGYGHNNIGQ